MYRTGVIMDQGSTLESKYLKKIQHGNQEMEGLIGAARGFRGDVKERLDLLNYVMEGMVSRKRMGGDLKRKVSLLKHSPKGSSQFEEMKSQLLESSNHRK